MGSLRSFHLLFILAAIVVCDLLGGWSIREYTLTHHAAALVVGVICFLAGFTAIGYGAWFVHKLPLKEGL